ncbi:MAG: nicotinate phosphoribosyltransferase [Acidobacteria bacterium]|nr:nicotinate phosphoribosyltransferase [Acidobacteriota bacterium]
MTALLTDLYQLTMAAGYYEAGKAKERATFELFVRRLPKNRDYYIACGIEQAVEYLLNLRFTEEEVEWLRAQPQFARASDGFFDALLRLRFTGELFAVEEGTPVYAGEPLLTLRAPIIEAQIPETFLLATIGFQTNIATKAARIVQAAGGRGVVEMGTRRAHSPEAGFYAARAAYVGGCLGTSNVAAARHFGIPMYGTSAHSWVLSFAGEKQAFEKLQALLGEKTVYLIDSYDTLQGARNAVSVGKPMWGVRIDSGDLASLSREVRKILDEAGYTEAKIMATGDLNEYKIASLADAPIDVFGVGTDLVTSSDSPSIAEVYKMVELDISGITRYIAKYSESKSTIPGAKQIFRQADHDIVGCAGECLSGRALLRPTIIRGQLVEPLPKIRQAVPPPRQPWPVKYSEELLELARRAKRNT